MNDINFTYKLQDASKPIDFQISDRAFVPTATSDFLIKGCKKEIEAPGKLLDLGCGIGIVGIALGLMDCATELYASDLSKDAVRLCEINAEAHNIEIEAKIGDGFAPWQGSTFDYIVDDISGVAEELAVKSEWFNNVPCNSGKDGTLLVVKILEEAENYLIPGGKVFFPIISLSNCDRIISTAKLRFKNVMKIDTNKWFMPEELAREIDLLERLKSEGHINFENKFGKIICFTDVYMAFN
jgi:precorrin-6B methylase 2